MNSIIAISFMLFLILSQITAYWGPKKLLIISAITSFLAGLSLGLEKGINFGNFLSGAIYGGFFLLLVVPLGLWTRYWRNRGRIKIDHYMNEHLDFLKKFRGGPKQ